MKTVLITGGTRGIGYGVASVLLDAGWHVTATGATTQEVDACPPHERLIRRVLDVTAQDQVDEVVGEIERLDGLVNCAGILLRGREFEIDAFERVLAVNLTGTMRMCLAARAALAAAGGAVVNTASMYAIFGGAHVPAYAASKGGVAQLSKSLAVAWADDGIRVNAVAPGWIETAMTDAARADEARNATILARTPQKKWGTPRDVGELVAWLLSDKAGFITGAVYPVDGGYSSSS